MFKHTASKVQEVLLVELGRVLRTFSLYGAIHPSTQSGIQALGKTLSDLLQAEHDLEIAMQEGKILISGKSVEDKNPVMKAILDLFNRLGILSLTFREGLTQEELLALIKIFAEATPKTKQTLKFEDVLKQSSIKNVEVNTAIYARVSKSQEEIHPAGETQPDQKLTSTSLQKMDESQLDDIITLFKSLSGFKRSKFLVKLAGKPGMIETLFGEGLTPKKIPQVKELLESICNVFLQKASKPGDNPLKILKSFDKYRNLLSKKIEGKEAVDLEQVLHQAYDTLRAQIIAQQYLQADQSQTNLAEIAKKWIKDPDELWNLIPHVKQILAEKGLGGVPVSELMAAFGEKYVVDQKEFRDDIQKILFEEVNDLDQKGKALPRILETVSQFISAEVKKSTEELRGANLHLVQEKQRMESIFESVSDGLIVADAKGKIRSINPAARALLGMGSEDPVDVDIFKKLMPGKIISLSQGKLGDMVGKTSEIQLMGDAVSKKTLRESVGVIRDENGQITGSIFTLSDVTRQRGIIEKKAELFSKVSYEMRISLTALKQSIQMLSSQLQGQIPEEQKKLLDVSQRGLQRLEGVLDHMDRPSRSEDKVGALSKQWVDIGILIQKTLDGMNDWILSKQMQIEINLHDQEVLLELDLDCFLDLLHVLIALHIRLTQRGGKILIETQSPLEHPEWLEIHFQSQSLNPEAPDLLSRLQSATTKEDFMTCLFDAIGMKLHRALEALQEEGTKYDISERGLTLSLLTV